MQNNKKWIRKGDILKNIVRTISIITILLLIILFFLFLKDDIKKENISYAASSGNSDI